MRVQSGFFSIGLLVAIAGPSWARQGPLTDPIPAPIPQSAIRVELTPIATGLTAPITFSVAGGGNARKYVVDQTGLILLLKGNRVSPTPVLDITGVMSQLSAPFPGAGPGLFPRYDERGLLGLAFHPGFNEVRSPGFRTFYTLHNVPVTKKADFPEPPFPNAGVTPNCQEVIAEWKMQRGNPDLANPSSYREILRYDKPQFNHNGGTIAFGPDGLLYAAFGDGGAANDVGDGHNPTTGNAQDLSTILGKVIRINPLNPRLTSARAGAVSANGQYRIPKDNPFVSNANALHEIYAFGFRNPYRFSFDARGGRLVLGDVGQNNIEEVDIVRKGGNYGWSRREGTFLFDPGTGNVAIDLAPDPGLISPVAEYDHFEASAGKVTRMAIVGGFVYRGSRIPALQGKYVCADLTGPLFVVDLKSGKIEKLLETGFFVKGFGQDANHEIYVLGSANEGPSGSDGSVLQITPVRRRGGR